MFDTGHLSRIRGAGEIDAAEWREVRAEVDVRRGSVRKKEHGRVLREHFGATVSDEELERERDVIDPPLRTHEELAYYRMFADRLPGVRAQGTIKRFVEA